MDCDEDSGLVSVMGGCICIEEKHELRLWISYGWHWDGLLNLGCVDGLGILDSGKTVQNARYLWRMFFS